MQTIKKIILALWTVGLLFLAAGVGVLVYSIAVPLLIVGAYLVFMGFLFAVNAKDKDANDENERE